MRSEVVDDMIERDTQVFKQRYLRTWFIVEGHSLIKDAEVARLLDICHRTENQPAGVVVESATDIIVAVLGQRLILMVASAVRELRRGNVDDALPSTFGYLMYESHEVLVAVTEAHSAPYSTFKERC